MIKTGIINLNNAHKVNNKLLKIENNKKIVERFFNLLAWDNNDLNSNYFFTIQCE